ncbi:MAG TPA: addiction module protein [Chthoniobacteraceae bacterium]|nr:addiction module protein [Chthoniobacteraceae bacterium]
MTEHAEKICAEALRLSESERAQLAHDLILSLDNGSDADAETAWDAELARRLEEIESGKAVGVPAEEVFAAIKARYS